MFDYTSYTANPNDKFVLDKARNHLSVRTKRYEQNRTDFLRELSNGKNVLDIGGGEHVEENSKSANWEHAILGQNAKSILGVDNDKDLVSQLVANGHNFVCLDATSDDYIGQKFDFVYIGDVIEHVDSPVNLIRFAKRHLAKDGKILVTTPNPFLHSNRFYRYRAGLKVGSYMDVNMQHICWVTPFNMLEICRRTRLDLSQILFPARNSIWQRLQRVFHLLLIGSSPELQWIEFMYLLSDEMDNNKLSSNHNSV
jgi:SAM-dependent methyltransferase